MSTTTTTSSMRFQLSFALLAVSTLAAGSAKAEDWATPGLDAAWGFLQTANSFLDSNLGLDNNLVDDVAAKSLMSFQHQEKIIGFTTSASAATAKTTSR